MLDKLKNLSKQTLIYGTSTILGRFLNFILVPFYTNVFTPQDYGIFSVIFAYIAFLMIFYSLGFESGYFKFASTLEEGNEKENFSIPFFTIAINSFILSSLIILFAPGIAVFLEGSDRYINIVRICALILFADSVCLIPFAYLRLKNKAGLFAIIKILNITINLILNFILVLVYKLGIEGVFISNLAASVITLLLLLPIISKNISFSFPRKLFDELWKFSLPYIPAGFAAILMQVVSRPILMVMTDEASVGIFQANFKLGIFMMLIVSMFEYAWRPFFLNNAGEPDAKELFSKVMLYFTGFTSIILIILTFSIDSIIKIPIFHSRTLIGPKYWSGVYIVPVVLYSYLVYGSYINLMAGIYIEKKSKYLPLITGSGAVVNILLNIFLIPYLGIMGSAIASFFGYLCMTCYIYYITHKYYPVRYPLEKIMLINGINILALLTYYLIYYKVIQLNLIANIFIAFVFILLITKISNLWKVTKLLKMQS